MGVRQTYTDNTLLSKGKYKLSRLYMVPVEYLLNIHKQGIKGCTDEALFYYVENNLDKIKMRMETGAIEIPEVHEENICVKVAFLTKKLAKEALKRIGDNNPHSHKKPIRSYECDKCNLWHLTSMPYEVWKENQRLEKRILVKQS